MLSYLQLPSLEDRRRQLRLTMLYKISGGQVPTMPPGFHLTPADMSRRPVKPARYSDCIMQNPIQRQAYNNSRGFKIPAARTDQYRGSFFIRNTVEPPTR